MKIYDLLDHDELTQMMNEGFVRRQIHPDHELAILNYTDKAVVNHVWNDVTRQCRGLIYNTYTQEVVARPFPKFFNYGEKESKTYGENERVVVTDKVDGSLGILYSTPDGQWAIATRGSFTSEQALHATEVLREKYSDALFSTSETWLFEIVYPENRIVVDYGGMDDLVLIGAVRIEEGWIYPAKYFDELDWPGPMTEVFEFESLSEALEARPRPGREGLVVHFLKSDTMVKLKQEDYLRLHKIVTGLNMHVVWEHLKNGGDPRTLAEQVPDEFHSFIYDTSNRLINDYYDLYQEVEGRFYELKERGLVEGPRKDFALAVKDLRPFVKSAMFLWLDDKPIYELIWKSLEPKKDTGVR